MMFLHTPSLIEDAKHASVVATSALAALAGSIALFMALQPEDVPEAEVALLEVIELPAVDASLGADRIYGRVLKSSGEEVTGYLRWNGREASWADVLPARESRGNAVAGLRFGHMRSLTQVDGRTVRITLKSGIVAEVAALPLEQGAGLAPLGVEMGQGERLDVAWPEVVSIEFLPEPLEVAPMAERIHGTVVTRSGMAFTGYVTWDLDRALQDAQLNGAAGSVSFSQLHEVHRRPEGGVRVVDTAGESRVLAGSSDLDRTNRGITVADPALGSVLIPFERFRELRVHPAEAPAEYDGFDGGSPIVGTLKTESGRTMSGEVRWDRDEAATWEMLDGQYEGVQFHIEFDQISWIQKTWLGATVELRDGRSFYLLASNDVNWTNKGIEVAGADGLHSVSWTDFARIDFTEWEPTTQR